MTLRAKLDLDIVCHDSGTATFTVNTMSEHSLASPSAVKFAGGATPATVGTAAVSVAGPAVVSTLVVKNEGTQPLLVAGMSAPIAAGRLAVLPITATSVSIASVTGQGAFSVLWVG